MFEWDDLRVFVMAARCGSFAAAGARLGMDATTVGRRVQRLETRLKSTLLVRSARGLQLTAAGAKLHALGAKVELAVEQAAEADGRLDGNVRISCSEGFGTQILAPALAKFHRKHPAMSIELAATQSFLSPSNREVDVAITLTPSNSPRLFVETLTHYELGLYGAKTYLDDAGRPATVEELPAFNFVGYIDDMIYAPQLRYLGEVHPGLHAHLSSSSIMAQAEFVRAGAGLAVLPCFLGEAAGLERLLPDVVNIRRTFWLSTHHDIKNSARVKLVRRWLTQLVAEQESLLNPSAHGRSAPAAAAR